jgi:hypothetical protein
MLYVIESMHEQPSSHIQGAGELGARSDGRMSAMSSRSNQPGSIRSGLF